MLKSRIGLVVEATDARKGIQIIKDAEAVGVEQVWMTQAPQTLDTLTFYAAVGAQTEKIRLGTSIVPTYPRHPLVLAQQALTVNDIAPGRLRLGVGPSHRPMIEGIYGIEQDEPLVHLREYVTVLRGALWEGRVSYHGKYINAEVENLRTAQVPILISALRGGAFQLAGEIADGVLPWLCPVPYLLGKAKSALQKGVEMQGRAVPPLIGHILVALSENAEAARAKTRELLGFYSTLPFYSKMFADAGLPVSADGKGLDELAQALVVAGNEGSVAKRLEELLRQGLDEVYVLSVPVRDAEKEQAQLARLIGSI